MTSSTAEARVWLGFAGQTICCESGQTVLEALTAAGLRVPSSCRNGVCQSCMLRAVSGAVPPESQLGLRPTWQRAGLFLACQCRPTEDLELTLPDALRTVVAARVIDREELGPDIFRIRLEGELEYRSGQFVTISRPDGLGRPYSLASLPGDPFLEIHVRKIHGGAMSTWLANEVEVGTCVEVRGPAGHCFYLDDYRDDALVLAGVGTGLAPLWGIVRDALAQGHTRPISLYHGARDANGLYLQRELLALQRAHSNLQMHFSTLEGESEARPSLQELVMHTATWQQTKVYLCGDPDFVHGLRRKIFLAGVPLQHIHADPFIAVAPSP